MPLSLTPPYQSFNNPIQCKTVVNIALLAAKIYAFVLSGSKAVMASAADSAVDLVSQVVIRCVCFG
jgi:divalent metal cation (Fe/Co/Zn/Cd) transporter